MHQYRSQSQHRHAAGFQHGDGAGNDGIGGNDDLGTGFRLTFHRDLSAVGKLTATPCAAVRPLRSNSGMKRPLRRNHPVSTHSVTRSALFRSAQDGMNGAASTTASARSGNIETEVSFRGSLRAAARQHQKRHASGPRMCRLGNSEDQIVRGPSLVSFCPASATPRLLTGRRVLIGFCR